MSRESREVLVILVVDDDPSVLKAWKQILADTRYRVIFYTDPRAALAYLEEHPVDVAVVDIRMPEMDGMEVLSLIKVKQPETEVVMMTGYGGVQDAVEAIKRGAYDFLTKPFENMEAAELTVRRATDRILLERRVKWLEQEKQQGQALHALIGQSPNFKKVIELVRNVAASPATVLIWGESGTGKELVARAIHENSPRRNHSMVTLNCSALTETLLESELFGHAKGAFTGALASHQGLFEAADNGTIFLDEIGDMSAATQVKLLRTLQDGEIRPVGSTRPVKVDVRVIAATHVDLELKCREGTFRHDLYYRLNVVRIDIPPLRERPEDITLLAHHFLLKYQESSGKRFRGIDPLAIKYCAQYQWPGNVRELENVMERAVILARGKTIVAADLPARIVGETEKHRQQENESSSPSADVEGQDIPFTEAKAKAVEQFEQQYLAQLLERHENITAAARAAGLDRSNFKRLLRRYNIQSGTK